MAKTNSIAISKMVRVYCRTADISSPKSLHAKVRREAAERMVDDRRARWVLPDAIQRTEVASEVVSDQPTITDSECEINAGAYPGLRRGAAATLSTAQVEAVRRKVAVWPEIYDQKAPLPGHCRNSNGSNTVRGITLMSRDELQELSDRAGRVHLFRNSATGPLAAQEQDADCWRRLCTAALQGR